MDRKSYFLDVPDAVMVKKHFITLSSKYIKVKNNDVKIICKEIFQITTLKK